MQTNIKEIMIYVLVYYQACARTQFSGDNFDFGKCSVLSWWKL